MFDILAATLIALSPARQAPAIDVTTCHQFDGQWRSDYSQSGNCTFGGRLDDVAPIAEDSPEFDCRVNGNQVCGIGNDQGVEPGYHGR
jgi:hypothetical protein